MNKTMRPEDDDIDSRDNPCTCGLEAMGIKGAIVLGPRSSQQDCPRHGIAASNARENRYWQRVGRD
jgi:hypothetical protein